MLIYCTQNKNQKGGQGISRKVLTTQEWLPFQEVLPNGIIKLKDNSMIKILIISPINFNLKSNLEKEAILNSYKIFLKTCNFNFQILIHSNKENLSKHISKIENADKKEEHKLIKLSQEYINFIQSINKERKSSCKEFYIMIKEKSDINKSKLYEGFFSVAMKTRKKEYLSEKKQILDIKEEEILYEKLNDNYFKIKECLSRCGNTVTDSNSSDMTTKILYSFFNTRKDLLGLEL